MRAAGRCDAHEQCQGTQGTEPGPGTSCHDKQCWCSAGDGAGGHAALISTGVSPKFVFHLRRQNSWGRDGVGGRALARECWFWGAVHGTRLSPSPPTATASYPRPEVTALPGRHFNCLPNYGLIWTFKVLWEGEKNRRRKERGCRCAGRPGAITASSCPGMLGCALRGRDAAGCRLGFVTLALQRRGELPLPRNLKVGSSLQVQPVTQGITQSLALTGRWFKTPK